MTNLETVPFEAVWLSTGREVRAGVSRHPSGSSVPACVLVHGNPGTAADWDRLFEPLARVASVAVLDLPGFGASRRPGAEPQLLDLEHLAADVLALADAAGFQHPLSLIGHSHGGGVVQVAAAACPERVQDLVLLGTLGITQTLAYRLLSVPGSRNLARAAAELAGWRSLRSHHARLLARILARIFHPEPVPV